MFWAGDFWAEGFWAEEFWVGVGSQNSGGYSGENYTYAARQKKKRKKKRLAALLRELYDDSHDF